MRSKRLASSGSCSRMSSDPTKMASEAHPLGLHLHPHLDDLGDGAHLPLPLLRELEERRAEARAHHRREVHHLVLERVCTSSSLGLSTRPRSWSPSKYLTTSKDCKRHVSAIWLMPFWLSGVFDHCPTYTRNGSKQCWDNKRKRQADERDQEIVERTQVDIAATATRAAALKPSTAVACWHVSYHLCSSRPTEASFCLAVRSCGVQAS